MARSWLSGGWAAAATLAAGMAPCARYFEKRAECSVLVIGWLLDGAPYCCTGAAALL